MAWTSRVHPTRFEVRQAFNRLTARPGSINNMCGSIRADGKACTFGRWLARKSDTLALHLPQKTPRMAKKPSNLRCTTVPSQAGFWTVAARLTPSMFDG